MFGLAKLSNGSRVILHSISSRLWVYINAKFSRPHRPSAVFELTNAPSQGLMHPRNNVKPKMREQLDLFNSNSSCLLSSSPDVRARLAIKTSRLMLLQEIPSSYHLHRSLPECLAFLHQKQIQVISQLEDSTTVLISAVYHSLLDQQ